MDRTGRTHPDVPLHEALGHWGHRPDLRLGCLLVRSDSSGRQRGAAVGQSVDGPIDPSKAPAPPLRVAMDDLRNGRAQKILLADGETPARRSGVAFREAVVSAAARIRIDALAHFGHWITPTIESRRFDTHFFLAEAPRDQVAVPDGTETLSVEWMPPARAVEFAVSGERPIIFPTMVNLARLAESSSSSEAIAKARERPPVTVQPEITVETGGGRRITIPLDAGYPVTEWLETRG